MSWKRRPPANNVRRVRSTGKNLRGVTTNKHNKIVQFESFSERTLLLRIDRDPTVLDYDSQPENFTFRDEHGKSHSYVPDFIVYRIDGNVEIHEVTREHRRTRSEIRAREIAAHDICHKRGWRYIVHTEHSLPKAAETANLLALVRFRPATFANAAVASAIFSWLAGKGSIPIHTLVTQVAHQLSLTEANVTSALCHLIWHGKVITDMQKLMFVDGSILPATLVWIPSGEKDNSETWALT